MKYDEMETFLNQYQFEIGLSIYNKTDRFGMNRNMTISSVVYYKLEGQVNAKFSHKIAQMLTRGEIR